MRVLFDMDFTQPGWEKHFLASCNDHRFDGCYVLLKQGHQLPVCPGCYATETDNEPASLAKHEPETA